MLFITFNANDAPAGEDGVCLQFSTSSYAESIARRCRTLLPKARFSIPDCVNVSPPLASIFLEPVRGMPELTARCLLDAMQIVSTVHRDYVIRHRKAINDERAIRRLPTDPAAEALNETLWGIHQAGGCTVIAPGQDFEMVLDPVDPTTLRVAEPDQKVEFDIRAALIIGCREVNGNQRVMFGADDDVEVIVSLAGEVPEIRLRTTRAEAQGFYRGLNRLSASVRKDGRGHIPEIIGGYEIGE